MIRYDFPQRIRSEASAHSEACRLGRSISRALKRGEHRTVKYLEGRRARLDTARRLAFPHGAPADDVSEWWSE